MTLVEKLLWLRLVQKWQKPPYNRKLWRKVKRLKREVRSELGDAPLCYCGQLHEMQLHWKITP